MNRSAPSRPGFTLIELLVVIAIVSLLVGLAVPALSHARRSGQRAVCLSNLHQINVAIRCYAGANGGVIPFGPKGRPVTGSNFYPCTGVVTSLISLENGDPVGLGLTLQEFLNQQPKALFCPGVDQLVDANAELAKVGTAQAQCSYYYRHNSVAILSGDPPPEHINLDDLGTNRNGLPIRALALDTMFLCDRSLWPFGVLPRTHHQLEYADVLFVDGHASTRPNMDGRFTVDIGYQPYDAFDKILSAFERADAEY